MLVTIQFRRGSETQWGTADTVLGSGEPGWDTTNKIVKIGDGLLPWSDLEPILNQAQVEALIATVSTGDAQVANAIGTGPLTQAELADSIDAKVTEDLDDDGSDIAQATDTRADTRINAAAGVTVAPVKASALGNRVVWLGDSITIAQGNEVNAPAQWGISYPTYATYFSKGRIVRLRNAGVSGNDVADMLARFDADVAAYAPSVVSIMGGTNDWNDSGTTSLTDYQGYIRALIAKVRALGALPVLCVPPGNVVSEARRRRTIIGNTWLRQYAADQGIPLVPFDQLLTDPATGDFLADYGTPSNDKTHPFNKAYAAMGRLWWEVVGPYLPRVDQLLPHENADPNNLLPNGLNLTTAGSGTTLVPTGWSIQSSVHPTGVTGSLVTGDTSIKGNWWRVVADGSASAINNEFVTISGNYAVGHPLAGTAKILPGHRYAFVGRFKATGLRNADTGSGSGFLLGLLFNSVLNTAGYDFRVASTHYYDVDEGAFYQEMTAPSDASSVLVRRQLLNTTAGAGTLQVAQMGLYDLTAMGLV